MGLLELPRFCFLPNACSNRCTSRFNRAFSIRPSLNCRSLVSSDWIKPLIRDAAFLCFFLHRLAPTKMEKEKKRNKLFNQNKNPHQKKQDNSGYINNTEYIDKTTYVASTFCSFTVSIARVICNICCSKSCCPAMATVNCCSNCIAREFARAHSSVFSRT